MRPVERGDSPQAQPFANHEDAKPELVSRLGLYCSYCERRIATNLAVEHIQPKGLSQYASLAGAWTNFLLACVNCNSTKGDDDVLLHDVLVPDRDNTHVAFDYSADGKVAPATTQTKAVQDLAAATLALCGLDMNPSTVTDANGEIVALDRIAQRLNVFAIALDSREDLHANTSPQMHRQVARTAVAHGFFSIWMTVFADVPVMRRLFVEEFKAAKDCFDPQTTASVSPRPDNGLAHGSKC